MYANSRTLRVSLGNIDLVIKTEASCNDVGCESNRDRDDPAGLKASSREPIEMKAPSGNNAIMNHKGHPFFNSCRTTICDAHSDKTFCSAADGRAVTSIHKRFVNEHLSPPLHEALEVRAHVPVFKAILGALQHRQR